MSSHSPHPRMWDRLNKVWGEASAVAAALLIREQNDKHRKVPLTEPVEVKS